MIELQSITYNNRRFTVGKSVLVIGEGPGGSPLIFESMIEKIIIEDDDFNIEISQNNYMTNFESYYIQQLVPITNKLLKQIKREFNFNETKACLISDFNKFYQMIKK